MAHKFGFDDGGVLTEIYNHYGFVGVPTLGPELLTNGDFATDTWWLTTGNATITGGEAVSVFPTAGTSTWMSPAIDIVPGRIYELSLNITSIQGQSLSYRLGNEGSSLGGFVGGTTGIKTVTLTCTSGGSGILSLTHTAGGGAIFDDISLRRV